MLKSSIIDSIPNSIESNSPEILKKNRHLSELGQELNPRNGHEGFEQQVHYFTNMVLKGGPEQWEYPTLNDQFQKILLRKYLGEYTAKEIASIRYCFSLIKRNGAILTLFSAFGEEQKRMPEFLYHIYTGSVSADPMVRKWDLFLQAQDLAALYRERFSKLAELTAQSLQKTSSDIKKILLVGHFAGIEFLEPGFRALECNNVMDLVCPALYYQKNAETSTAGGCRNIRWLSSNIYNTEILRQNVWDGYAFIWASSYLDFAGPALFRSELVRLAGLLCKGGTLVIPCFPPFLQSKYLVAAFTDKILFGRNIDQLNQIARTLTEEGFTHKVLVGHNNLFLLILKSK